MISSRKKKLVVKKLNTFFEANRGIPTKAEYRLKASVPFTLAQLDSYLGGYERAVMFVKQYFPKWKEPVVVQEAPKINLDALESYNDE